MVRYAAGEGVHASEFDDEVVLLDAVSGLYFRLNETGAFIWQRLMRGETRESITADLCRRYEIGVANADADVTALVDLLAERGLIQATA